MAANVSKGDFTQHLEVSDVHLVERGQLITVAFDGCKLEIDGSVEHVYKNSDDLRARALLYYTMATPDKFANRSALTAEGKLTMSSHSVLHAHDSLMHLLRPIFGRNLIDLTMGAQNSKNSPLIVKGATFVTRPAQVDMEQDTKQVVFEPGVGLRLTPKGNLLGESNQQWLKGLQSERLEFRDMDFSIFAPESVAVFSILHRYEGQERSVTFLFDEFKIMTKADVVFADFVRIMQIAVGDYTRSPELRSRITFRPMGGEGLFVWRHPRYKT